MIGLLRTYTICLFLVAISGLTAWAWLTTARSHVAADLTQSHDARKSIQKIQLHIRRLPISEQGTPQPDYVATLARRILVSAGVPQNALIGIQPLGETPLPGGSWHRQQVLLQLRGMTTGQSAAVVDAVAKIDRSWAVTGVQLSHTGPGDTYDAGLALTTLYPAKP